MPLERNSCKPIRLRFPSETLQWPKFYGMESYNQAMARGWESKSVEAQQEDAAARTSSEKPRLTREETARVRDRENLRLSLQSVLEQL